MKRQAIFAAILVGLAALPSRSDAQIYVTPFVGGAFGGSTDDSKVTFGGNVTFATSGVLGFGIDLGYTKDFFGERFAGGNNNVTTLMGNLVLLTPGHPRLYVSGGAGLLKTRVRSTSQFLDVSSNDWGMNVGAGFFLVKGPVGLNGDIRYIRRLTDPEPDGEFDVDFGALKYWRATAGVSFRF